MKNKQKNEQVKQCLPFTLGTFLNASRNDTGAIYVSVVDIRNKRSVEAYIYTEYAKNKIWDVFEKDARIVGINFLDQAIPSMRISVEE